MRPYVRAANVGWSGVLLDDVKTMNFTDSEMDAYRLEQGDLLLGEASGSASEVGKPAIWRGEIADCAFQNTLIRVRPKGPDPEYLLHYFRHQALSGKLAAAARGVGIYHLGSDALAKWIGPVAATCGTTADRRGVESG
jgi:type I restriction enzyme S subunit